MEEENEENQDRLNHHISDEDHLLPHNIEEVIVVERKPWRSFVMILTMFTIISSLRMVYSTIASFLPHYISVNQESITSSKTGFILA